VPPRIARRKVSDIQKVTREPGIADVVAGQLRSAIVEGKFPAGARMRQEELAARLAVSRAPVRQALVMLEREGLVVSDRWRGAVVAPLDVALIKDLYEFRGVIERYVGWTLASRKTADMKPLRRIVETGAAAARTDDVTRLIELDLRFHTGLYEAVGNRVLLDVMNSHWMHTRRVMATTLKERGYPKTAWDEHAGILEAIELGDPDLASQRAAAHIAAAAVRIVDTFTTGLSRGEKAAEPPRRTRSRSVRRR
jgi:DNA-binding GntR family transcriptional regulator